MTILKRNKFSTTNTSDRFRASAASLGEELSKAVATVWLLFFRCEFLPCELLGAVCAGEALTMPWCVLVADATFVDHIRTLSAALGVLGLETWHADDSLVTWDETFVPDWLAAFSASKAVVMPLLAFVFKFLHASSERLSTLITPGSEVVVVAVAAVNLLVLGGKRLVHQRRLAPTALETELMPVSLFVRQILEVRPNRFATFVTVVREMLLVARNTVRMLFFYNVTTGYQLFVASLAC